MSTIAGPAHRGVPAPPLLLETAEATDIDEAANACVDILAPDETRKLMLSHLVPDGHCARLG
eukprot:1538922-Pyramimonas_sp.AAC.2